MNDAPTMVPLVNEEEAPEDVAALLAHIREALGTPRTTNFFAAMGNSISALEAVWGVIRGTLTVGKVPAPVKLMILFAVAASRSCQYCQAAHAASCRMVGVDQQTLDAIAAEAEAPAIEPPTVAAMIQFAVKAALKPGEIAQEDYEQMYRLGLSLEECVELVNAGAVGLYAVVVADALHIPVDPVHDQLGRG